MSCKKQFNRDFLTEACTSAFLGGSFKQHRENTLLDREKGLLIETQPYVLIEKEKKKLRDQCSQLYSEIGTYESIIRVKRNQINNLQDRIARINPNNINETPEEARKFIRKCPINNCRGFLSTRWKCGTCDAFICNKCNEPKDEDAANPHVCDPANVASMELLNKDTKPCPECATMIYRIEGCFAENTPILLWNGTTKMSQYISVGDQLVGDDGTVRNVIKITSGIDTLYKVEQSDGIDYIVNSKHTLVLKPNSNNSAIAF
jgi:hypothetical protein